jgi:hypothetical protein
VAATEHAILGLEGHQPVLIMVEPGAKIHKVPKTDKAPKHVRGKVFNRAIWYDPIFLLPVFIEA